MEEGETIVGKQERNESQTAARKKIVSRETGRKSSENPSAVITNQHLTCTLSSAQSLHFELCIGKKKKDTWWHWIIILKLESQGQEGIKLQEMCQRWDVSFRFCHDLTSLILATCPRFASDQMSSLYLGFLTFTYIFICITFNFICITFKWKLVRQIGDLINVIKRHLTEAKWTFPALSEEQEKWDYISHILITWPNLTHFTHTNSLSHFETTS